MRRARRRRERGAAAVEFALVSPLLLVLLFGIVDYGLYFADVLTIQQGVADAARSATLAPPGPTGAACPAGAGQPPVIGTSPLTPLACNVEANVKPLTGVVYARAELVDPNGAASVEWASGGRLRLCTLTDHPPVLPFVPLPNGGLIRTLVDMPLQQSANASVVVNSVQADASGLGTDWSWC